MKRYLYIVLFSVLLLSCERELRYTGDQSESVLVLEATPQAGSKSLVCYINRSRFFLDITRTDSASMSKVFIDLTTSSGACSIVKDSVVGLMHHLLLSDPLPGGDTLHLTVSHPDLPTIEADEYIVPACMPAIKSLKRDSTGYHLTMCLPDYPYKNGRIGINGVLYTTFTNILPDTTISRQYTLTKVQSKDQIFASLNSFYLMYESYIAYTDQGERLFFYSDYPTDTPMHLFFDCPRDGKNTSFHLDSIVLSLEARSATYTTYYASLRSYMNQNSGGSGMSVEEPVSVYTNVTNGYGVLASKTYSKIIIKFK